MQNIVYMSVTGEPTFRPYLNIVAETIAHAFLTGDETLCPESKITSEYIKPHHNIKYSPEQEDILNRKGVYFLYRRNLFDSMNDSNYIGSSLATFRERLRRIIQYINGVFYNGDKNLAVARKWRERYGERNTKDMYVRFFPLSDFSNEQIRLLETMVCNIMAESIPKHQLLNEVMTPTSAYTATDIPKNKNDFFLEKNPFLLDFIHNPR